ncbi:UNVERIFIED_CONTAM: hypothetical protein RKD43_002953 [Streptomyces graminofaciens]
MVEADEPQPLLVGLEHGRRIAGVEDALEGDGTVLQEKIAGEVHLAVAALPDGPHHLVLLVQPLAAREAVPGLLGDERVRVADGHGRQIGQPVTGRADDELAGTRRSGELLLGRLRVEQRGLDVDGAAEQGVRLFGGAVQRARRAELFQHPAQPWGQGGRPPAGQLPQPLLGLREPAHPGAEPFRAAGGPVGAEEFVAHPGEERGAGVAEDEQEPALAVGEERGEEPQHLVVGGGRPVDGQEGGDQRRALGRDPSEQVPVRAARRTVRGGIETDTVRRVPGQPGDGAVRGVDRDVDAARLRLTRHLRRARRAALDGRCLRRALLTVGEGEHRSDRVQHVVLALAGEHGLHRIGVRCAVEPARQPPVQPRHAPGGGPVVGDRDIVRHGRLAGDRQAQPLQRQVLQHRLGRDHVRVVPAHPRLRRAELVRHDADDPPGPAVHDGASAVTATYHVRRVQRVELHPLRRRRGTAAPHQPGVQMLPAGQVLRVTGEVHHVAARGDLPVQYGVRDRRFLVQLEQREIAAVLARRHDQVLPQQPGPQGLRGVSGRGVGYVDVDLLQRGADAGGVRAHQDDMRAGEHQAAGQQHPGAERPARPIRSAEQTYPPTLFMYCGVGCANRLAHTAQR